MKKLFTLLFFFSLCAVNFAQIQKGIVELENGAEEKLSVPYQTFNCNLTQQDINSLSFVVGLNAKSVCKNRLSYTPRKVEIMQASDTATVIMKFSAKNGYGAEGGLRIICQYKINNLDKERRDLLTDYVLIKNYGAISD
jgi:hypothetical protein